MGKAYLEPQASRNTRELGREQAYEEGFLPLPPLPKSPTDPSTGGRVGSSCVGCQAQQETMALVGKFSLPAPAGPLCPPCREQALEGGTYVSLLPLSPAELGSVCRYSLQPSPGAVQEQLWGSPLHPGQVGTVVTAAAEVGFGWTTTPHLDLFLTTFNFAVFRVPQQTDSRMWTVCQKTGSRAVLLSVNRCLNVDWGYYKWEQWIFLIAPFLINRTFAIE